MLKAIIGFIGFIYLYSKLKSIVLLFFNMIYGTKRDLGSIYGKGSYVLITGGSEGIGEALATEFASRGFNLILISRSMEKLQLAKKTIESKFKKCKVVIASFDFNMIDRPENFDLQKAFGLDFSKLDVSIVVNNVGIGRNGTFYESDEESIKKMIRVNIVPEVLLTRYFISIFLKRKNRSAFLNLSSLSEIHALPFYDLYGATKKFNSHFSESIGNFYPNIDTYTFLPGWVSTRLTNFNTASLFSINTTDCAREAINNFGSYRNIFAGHWKHEILYQFMSLLPTKLISMLIMRNKKNYIKAQSKE
jgi:17beta-estradiol 17-dehydrogenase / very-long-chain 3-oxoacyl-CoA reductase